MKPTAFRVFMSVFFISLIISYDNCGSTLPYKFSKNSNTIAGNPFNPSLASKEVLSAICSVLTRCQPQLTSDACSQGVLDANGIGQKLGLPPGTFDPYSSLMNAAASGIIAANSNSTNSCTQAINNLSCTDPTVVNAYNSSLPDPFANVSQMVPTTLGSCNNVFLPVGWSQLLNTQLQPQCPTDPTIQGMTGCSTLVKTGGAIADITRNRMILWGGGFSDYYGNEIYSLDLNTQTMIRLNNPSPVSLCTSTTSDGKPNSRQTSNNLAYITHADRLFSFGGDVACTGVARFQDTWTLDLGSLAWSTMDPHGGGVTPAQSNPAGLGGLLLTDYDPVTKLVFIADSAQFFSYNYDTNSYGLLNATANLDDMMTATIDPQKRLFIAFGHGHAAAINIGTGSDYSVQSWDSMVSGCTALVNASFPGLAYDSALGAVVGWAGGDSLYIFDSNTKTCTVKTYPGGPGAVQGSGTFGRFRYFPSLDTFILINDWQQNAYRLKLQ